MWSKRSASKDQALELAVLQAASGVITTVGGELVQRLQKKVPQQRIEVLPNGFIRTTRYRSSRKENDAFHLVYTGLLTQNQAHVKLFLR